MRVQDRLFGFAEWKRSRLSLMKAFISLSNRYNCKNCGAVIGFKYSLKMTHVLFDVCNVLPWKKVWYVM